MREGRREQIIVLVAAGECVYVVSPSGITAFN
jgi:hypothetical protein